MSSFTFTPYERPHYEAVMDLLFSSQRTHTHLDWITAGRWLDTPNIVTVLAWQTGRLAGIMGANAPHAGMAWVRLLAIENESEPARVLSLLWQALWATFGDNPPEQLSMLAINRWVTPYLGALGMRYTEDVVSMSRVGGSLPTLPASSTTIENAYLDALADMVAVDHRAFPPMWRMSRDEIRQAQRQSASTSIAVHAGRVVGYQISTRHDKAAHLARIAVSPEMQGQGVGAHLLAHLITGMARRGVQTISVNTQQSNLRSQRLYTRFGFRRTGYDLPVWMATHTP